MNDDVWKRDEIDSPCVRICMIHPQARICLGCYRTGEEIARWSAMSADERREIMAGLPARGAGLTRRSGGRSARLKSRAPRT